MKKVLLSCCFATAVSSFSFRLLKDIFYYDMEGFSNLEDRVLKTGSVVRLGLIQEIKKKQILRCMPSIARIYLYDEATSLSFYEEITLREDCKTNLEEILTCISENKIENMFTNFRYGKIKMEFDAPFIRYYQIYEGEEWGNPVDALMIGKQNTTFSGVKIENTENGVFLNKDGKSIRLEMALKLHEVPIDKYELDCLKNSTILSVIAAISKIEPRQLLYNKVKVEKGKETNAYIINGLLSKKITIYPENTSRLPYWHYKNFSFDKINFEKYNKFIEKDKLMNLVGQKSILVGLAKDNKTGEIFHWITDFKQDISVSMKYAT